MLDSNFGVGTNKEKSWKKESRKKKIYVLAPFKKPLHVLIGRKRPGKSCTRTIPHSLPPKLPPSPWLELEESLILNSLSHMFFFFAVTSPQGCRTARPVVRWIHLTTTRTTHVCSSLVPLTIPGTKFSPVEQIGYASSSRTLLLHQQTKYRDLVVCGRRITRTQSLNGAPSELLGFPQTIGIVTGLLILVSVVLSNCRADSLPSLCLILFSSTSPPFPWSSYKNLRTKYETVLVLIGNPTNRKRCSSWLYYLFE